MPTHVTKSKNYPKNFILAAALGLSCQAALAQNAPAPNIPPPAPPAPAPKAPLTDPAAMAPVDNSTSTALDYLFNHKPGEGTTAKAGGDVASAISDKIRAIDVLKTPGLDDPVLRARFETYLSLKEISDDRIKAYFDKWNQARELLKSGDAFAAWKILYALSEDKEIDAGISRELANRVESVWNDNRTKDNLEQANDQLRDNIDTANRNADLIASDLHQRELEENRKQGKAASGGNSNNNNQNNNSTNSPLLNPNADPTAAEASMMPTMSGSLQGKMELTAEYLKLLEARAKIKLNEIQANNMSDEGRRDFAEYIKSLYDTHRYYHMILAADFYRALFNEGDYPAAVTKQNAAPRGNTSFAGNNAQSPANVAAAAAGISNPLSQSPGDHPVSMSEQVTAALEANNRVSQAIEVFKYKANKNEVAAAAEQLQEAFVGNEFHPGLLALPRVQKEQVGDFLSKLSVLKNQIEARDFGPVETQINEIKKIAVDFDSTKTMALVNGVKLESRLRLGKARLLAQQQHLTEAMNEFQTAAEEWPGNPDLQNSASGFFNTEDLQNQSTADFDRLVQDQNYRAIFDKQLAFAPALRDDPARLQQFKDALGKVKAAEMSSEKANMLVMNGDVDGAWETIEKATKEWPDDQKLNRLLADLSGRGADFVSAINKARDAEAKKELGYSLTWYVNAQNFYPASLIANEGIDRISKQILSVKSSSTETIQ
jgi:hypothetical protein